MSDLEPVTREEKLLDGQELEPITRKEKFIKRIYDKTQEIPEPVTREEYFLKKAGEGGGGDVTIEQLNVSENGTYSEEGKAYSPVVVNVPLPQNALLLKDIPSTPTAIATFSDGAEMVMPSLTVGVDAWQEGSGDPSPTNERPIHGWDSVDVSVMGKNLFDKANVLNGYMTSDGTFKASNAGEKTFYCKVPKGTITMGKPVGTKVLRGVLFDEIPSNNDVGYTVLPYESNKKQTFTTTKETYYVCFCYNNTGETDTWESVLDSIQVEIGNTPTTYEPFTGSITTIDLDGTRYGGRLEIVNGVARFIGDRIKWTLTPTESEIASVNIKACSISIPSDKRPNDWDVNVNKCMCNKLKVSNYSAQFDNHVHFPNVLLIALYLADEIGTTKQDWVDYLAQAQIEVSYKLAEPVIIPLGNYPISSLEGDNNVVADSGEILEGEYLGGVS